MAEEDTDWSYSSTVPTLSSGLEPGGHYIHEGTTLVSNQQLRTRLPEAGRISGERMQLNTGLSHRQHDPNSFKDRMMSYQDSGFSEEDGDHQVTTCLMKTPSGSIYIQPTNQKINNMTLDTRLDSHYSQPGFGTNRLPPKDCSDSDRSTTQLKQLSGTLQSNLNTLQSGKPGFHNFTKDLNACSWRAVAIFFIVLTIAMASTLAFVIASTLVTPSQTDIAKACAVVDTLKDENLVTQFEDLSRSPPRPDSREIRLPEKFNTRNFPPDGTTFQQIVLGQKLAVTIPPFGYLNVQFFHQDASYVTFDLHVPRGTSFGLYARRNALPTHTHYNFMEVITGFKDHTRSARSAENIVRRVNNFFMEEGHWFVSLYNDDGGAHDVEMMPKSSKELTEGCSNGCNGHGDCVLGKCQCHPGYDGEHCSQSVCPLLCSGQGDYINGECLCKPGWKGKECNIRYEECEVPDCSGHGHCEDGKCICMKGYKGEFCNEADCPDPMCSGHGFCISGVCICKKGWLGLECSEVDPTAKQCLPGCSTHGRLDMKTQSCKCDEGWTGKDCSVQLCNLDCGEHGQCENMRCVCEQGWSGMQCQSRECDPRCQLHGQCKNGTCLCVTGWNGRHCTIEGCPKQCSDNGQCRSNFHGDWSCECKDGWDGVDCSTRLETNCNDGLDNDGDGLRDCEDPECCENRDCQSNQLCYTVPKPINILLQRQPPAPTASFFQKMRFIIEEGSLQRYSKNSAFNESRVAVIRGQVVTSSGRGLVGVRITRSDRLSEGYTMTREDGWFDFMVNGGGAVTLQFGKNPFPPKIETLFAPWNEVIVMEPVVMSMTEVPSKKSGDSCDEHDYENIQPIVIASAKFGIRRLQADKSSIIAETQSLFETISIPASQTKLVYSSPRSRGYLSTIQLQLTPENIPAALSKIYLRITIEGELFEKIFEADPNLKYTYSWKGINVYRQRVYGTTTALVKVGYEYDSCSQIIWNVQSTRISGQDLSVSNIGGWDLDIHHRYNFQEGILYKGDGTNIYLKDTPALIFTTMGDGSRRTVDCSRCDGTALQQRLLSPFAIVSSPDGSLFLGDFNLIRRISSDGQVRTILKLNATSVAHRYYLAVNPQTGALYVSDPEAHRIMEVIDIENPRDIENNWQTLIGSGIRCLPGDEDRCGDGGPARYARLIYPKGIAVSSEGNVYFADGTTIRMMDQKGSLVTLIKPHLQNNHWKPLPCEGTLSLEEATLRWPTELAVNPLDNSVHFIDDNIVMKVTENGHLKVVAGRPLHCSRPRSSFFTNFASYTTLASPQAIAFSPTGELYVSESDSRRINRISVVGTDGRISLFAGKDSKCNCQETSCNCFNANNNLAIHSQFRFISGLTATPDGSIHICDQTNYRIRTIRNRIPNINADQQYEVHSPESQETYVFNRFGLHMATKSIATKEVLFIFAYSVSTSTGSLVSVTDSTGGKINIIRNYAGQVESIENAARQKFSLKVDRKHMLRSFIYAHNNTVEIDYYRSSELLRSRRDSSGKTYMYDYDINGRVEKAITPTGGIIHLKSDISIYGAMVNITRNNKKELSLLIQKSFVHKSMGHEVEIIQIESDRSFITESRWGHKFVTKTAPYILLHGENPGLAESFPVPSIERTEIGKDIVNQVEWTYYANDNSEPSSNVGKKLKVNGEAVLSVELDRHTGNQVISLDSRRTVVSVNRTKYSTQISSQPGGIFPTITEQYNSIGLPVSWSMGSLVESYAYDRQNRLTEVKLGDSPGSLQYIYKDHLGERRNEPVKVVIPSGGGFLLQHDATGALESIMTPRGHIHSFLQQLCVGYYKVKYQAPWSKDPYIQQYDQTGSLLSKKYPGNSGKVIFVYDNASHLRAVIGGSSTIHYHYISGTALVNNIDIVDDTFHMKTRKRHHRGSVKEIHREFLNNVGLNNYTIKYQYDATGRLSTTALEIIGLSEQTTLIKYDSKNGKLKGLSDLRISHRSFNMVIMEDLTKNFVREKKYDEYGRFESLNLIIKSQPLFRVNIEYNANSLISLKSVFLMHKTTNEEIAYNANNQVNIVKSESNSNWVYTHDVNGNIVSVTERGNRIALGYDSGDRVVQFGDLEFVTYDDRGFVIRRGEQRYTYNALGQMISAFEPGKFAVRFYYDDEKRLLGSQDHRGNLVQYIYANPSARGQVTHIHDPKLGQIQQLYYDEDNLLVALEAVDNRFYIATDDAGSPLAVFDTRGKLVKQMKRTPFGRTMHDSNPNVELPIDFHGGILEKHTRLIHFGDRVYDPVLGQWMTPDWEGLGKDIQSPFEVFSYRFMNNNPVNRNQELVRYEGPKGWLELVGLDIGDIVGSEYMTRDIIQPSPVHRAESMFESNPEINLAIKESYQLSRQSFLSPSFLQKKHQLCEIKRRLNLSPRISVKSSIFGDGMLLSKLDKRIIVTLVSEAVNEVFQSVFSSILNGSEMLDIESASDAEEYFFIKEENQYLNDLEELERLSGSYNVSKGAIRGGGEQVCVKNSSPDFSICMLYGAREERALRQRLRQAHRAAVKDCWNQEVQRVKLGFHGEWSPSERDELLRNGEVRGFTGEEIHSVHKFPSLIGQASNIRFVRQNEAQSRIHML